MKSTFKLVLASAIASMALVGTANAQHHGGGGGFHGGAGVSAYHGGGYHGGGYYRGGYGYHRGYGGYGWGGWGLGTALAIGLTVPFLPYAYSTYYYGGVPYYAADGVYYNQIDGGYQVVQPPQGLTQAPSTSATTSSMPAPVIYPRNNQSAQQQESDQQSCNKWATSQPAAMADASVFQRSVAACMDARGYTLR